MNMDTARHTRIFRHPFYEGRKDSRTLLYTAASHHTGLSTAELGPVEAGPKGKPYFAQLPALHFSVTHSANWWMCAFSSIPVGLDLQIHRSFYNPSALSRRFLHPREEAFLAQHEHHNFFDMWAAKESWIKYTGNGFYDVLSTFCLVSPEGDFPALHGVEFRLLPFAPEYSLCLCAKKIDQVELVAL